MGEVGQSEGVEDGMDGDDEGVVVGIDSPKPEVRKNDVLDLLAYPLTYLPRALQL